MNEEKCADGLKMNRRLKMNNRLIDFRHEIVLARNDLCMAYYVML
jgi:hypothetical protein